MLPDRVSNPGPLTYEAGALPIALCGPALLLKMLTTLNMTGMSLDTHSLTMTFSVVTAFFYLSKIIQIPHVHVYSNKYLYNFIQLMISEPHFFRLHSDST